MNKESDCSGNGYGTGFYGADCLWRFGSKKRLKILLMRLIQLQWLILEIGGRYRSHREENQ